MRPLCALLAAAATSVAVVLAATAVPPAAAQRSVGGHGTLAATAKAITTPKAKATAEPTKVPATATLTPPSVPALPRGQYLGERPKSAPVPSGSPRQVRPPPPTASNVTACLAAYLATPADDISAIPAYLCCVDPSMGFCEKSVEFGAGQQVCTLDTSELEGGCRCCYTQPPAGRRAGDGGTPLAVQCTKLAPCAGCTFPGAAGCADRPDGCASRAPDMYQRCDLQVCVVQSGRSGRSIPRRFVRQTFCGWFGTTAQCCLMKKMWYQRVKCCRQCRVPDWKRKSWGCCYPGKRPW